MKLTYTGQKTREEILKNTPKVSLKRVSGNKESSNFLIKGENLQIMKTLIEDFNMRGKVDLVYIDPPFSTNSIYRNGKNRTATVSSSRSDEIAYSDKLVGSDFLEFIRERLFLIKELMGNHSSIYVHIDYKIGHYVKIIMDEVFDIKNFRNDITRIKCNPKNFSRKGYGNIKDMILFYTKSNRFIWNEPLVERGANEIKRLFNKVDKSGRSYTTNPLHAPGETRNGKTGKMWKGMLPPPGRHWRYDPKVLDELDKKGLIEWSKSGTPRKIIYADNYSKKRLQDIWEFKDTQRPTYPTEKNLELLKTIIETSSNKDSLIFDCFCGSGTTLVAADKLQRKWIGMDNSTNAINTAIKKLSNNTPLLSNYQYYEQR